MILFEVGGVDKKTADEAMHLAASKLPIKTKVAYRPTVE
jgi:Ribosomal protein L16/L10E